MVLFVVLSALWLVAAGTAQVWIHSTAPCTGPCPDAGPPSYTSLHVWLLLGIAGAILTLASFGLVVGRAVGDSRTVGTARLVRWAVAAGFTGALAEAVVVLLITHVAIATAPSGLYSGEGGAAIVILGVAQLVLVGALALVWGRILRLRLAEPGPRAHQTRPWAATVVGLGGTMLGCGAFAAWSLQDGTTPLVVNTSLIGGPAFVTNVGAWWPGLFAGMLALALVTAACAPGMTSRAEGKVALSPSTSDRTGSPAAAP